ncbi:MAG: N-acetylmuramoyl-L-alanine amidase [Sphingomonas bacterium]|nr:N-acetylmuramoyl-L-alanine amidase [Sphingomonas bacterium]
MPFRWTVATQARQYPLVSFILALLACWLGGSPAWAATVERVDIRHDRIVIRFDQSVADASSFVLAGPQRIAVDVAGASPGGPVDAKGMVVAVRQAAHGDDGTRIVFDLARPAIVTEGVFGRDGRELTLELRTVDDASFARAAAEQRLRFLPPFNMGTITPSRKYEVSIPVPKSSRSLPLPRVYGDDDSRPLVVIDPGHGGIDPGAISPIDGRREKDVTLRIAKAIRDELLRSGRVRVALTREDDKFLVLQERYGIARKLKANLFISVHCDSVGSGDASGATVYTLSEVASDKESARLAARENKADIIQGVNLATTSADISSILIDLTQRETMNNSASFARLLGREAQPLMPVKPNFHRMASLVVLKAPDMPSILFETGYISNPKDAAFIDSSDGRERIAESVRRAVDIHFARRLASNDQDTTGMGSPSR